MDIKISDRLLYQKALNEVVKLQNDLIIQKAINDEKDTYIIELQEKLAEFEECDNNEGN
ncbi:hypothetical protein HGQ82_08780 [Clostridioides difficile]|uniref:hypothetical protein n=1 Tax=Clostridioides difficile TaxID=1496 RepID=UPI00146B1FD3|nr:hypothetical protein [Clostridioides difficile]NMU16451.1 hypothetical protein [Clostridioides difficile]